MNDYAVIYCRADNEIEIIPCESADLDLAMLSGLVHGFIEIVAPIGLLSISPYLRMVVDEEGLFKDNDLNLTASVLYGHDIVGDMVITTCYNPDNPEPNVYALPYAEAERYAKALERAVERLGP